MIDVITIPKMTADMAERAAAIANQRMRDVFLNDDSPFVKRMTQLGGPSLSHMRRSWNPLEPRVITPNRIAMQVRTSDVIHMTFSERQQIQAIVMEASMKAIHQNPKQFLTAILNDAISEEPELKYG